MLQHRSDISVRDHFDTGLISNSRGPLTDAGRALVALGEALLSLAQESAPAAAIDPLQLLDAKQIEQLFGVSTSEVRKLIAAGDLPAVRVGRLVRVRRATLEAWLAERESTAAEPDAAVPWGLG